MTKNLLNFKIRHSFSGVFKERRSTFSFCLATILFFSQLGLSSLKAQTITGIINQYHAVSAIDYCANQVTIADASGLSVGQKMLLIQMQGAAASTTNNSTFGTITDYGNAGNYEIVQIGGISGGNVLFQYPLLNTYTPGSGLQLVTVPVYSSVTVDTLITCQAWNGVTGGVLALEAETLTLNGNIDVSFLGFRGGKDSLSAFNCSWSTVQTAFSYGFHQTPFGRGAIKGEGIGGTITNHQCGKGALTNAGGGGNDHNSGGAGGGNFGAGGDGGRNRETRTFYCKGQNPGIGGRALTYSNAINKVFMGGGGGAGHRNNHVEYPSAGGNGGGIILLRIGTLIGNNFAIRANGHWPDSTYNDGAGGGGAAGVIMLEVSNFSDSLSLHVQGGDGGKLVSDPGQCMGPGGGGAGGVLWFSSSSLPSVVTTHTNGGIAGYNFLWSHSTTCFGLNNNATAGANGGILYNLEIQENLTWPTGTATWTGDISSDWYNACNWSILAVPGPTTEAVVPDSSPNFPEISASSLLFTGDARCQKITIQPGAELIIRSGATLRVNE